MILQSLAAYGDQLRRNEEIPCAGFQNVRIRWLVEIDTSGTFLSLRETGGEQPEEYEAPAQIKRASNVAANLLWDKVDYALGIFVSNDKEPPEKAESRRRQTPVRHTAFVRRVESFLDDWRGDEGVSALYAFLTSGRVSEIAESDAWHDVKHGDYVSFRLASDEGPVFSRPAVKDRISKLASEPPKKDEPLYRCLVTGESCGIARLHPPIKGLSGGISTGVNIVSFNLKAFESYGWKQGSNSSVGATSTRNYTDALNYLLSRSSNLSHSEGKSTFVFWAQSESGTEAEERVRDAISGWSEYGSDGSEVRKAFKLVRKAFKPILNNETPFFLAGISPNSGRASVFLWHEGTARSFAEKILRHYSDLDIEGLWRPKTNPSLWRLMGAISIKGDPKGLQVNFRGKVSAGIVEAILTGCPYPATLLSRLAERCAAERSVWPIRAALMKASLNRNARIRGVPEKEMTVGLDKQNTNIGYRLGRWFATLEKIQEDVNQAAKTSVNATIRDKFLGAMRQSPRAVFDKLERLKTSHLAKLRKIKPGLAIARDKVASEIAESFNSESGIPARLSLDDKCRFFIGYYHQRSWFYTKKEDAQEEDNQ